MNLTDLTNKNTDGQFTLTGFQPALIKYFVRMKYFIFYIPLLTIVSCNNVEKATGIIDVENAIEIKTGHVLDPYIKSIEFIPLEWTGENPIGWTQSIQLTEHFIYVLDQRTYIIYSFSLDGKYISALDRIGRGNGEYSIIKNFSVDKQGLVHVLTHYRLLTYNSENSFLYEMKLPDKENTIMDFVNIGFKKTICYKSYSTSMNGEGDLLLFIEEGEIKDKFGNVSLKESRMKKFFKYNNHFNIVPTINDNKIYSVDSSFNVTKKYEIKFGNYSAEIPGSLQRNIDTKENLFMINGIVETNNCVYGWYGGNPLRYFVYDKNNLSCFKGNIAISEIGGGFPLSVHNISDDGQYLIGITSSLSMIEYADQLVEDNVLSQNEINKLKDISIEGNPIIIKIKLY